MADTLGKSVTVYEFKAFGPSSTGRSWLALNVDTSRFNWVTIKWPRSLYPLDVSIRTGVELAVSAIRQTPGRVVLVGNSIGAAIASNVYDEFRTGRLQDRRGDLIFGAVFLNPRRQEGHSFRGCPDPGGAGIMTPNLTDCDDFWWEFPLPNDPASCWPNDYSQLADWGRSVFSDFLMTYTGNIYQCLDRFVNPEVSLDTLAVAFEAIVEGRSLDDLSAANYGPLAANSTFPYLFPFKWAA